MSLQQSDIKTIIDEVVKNAVILIDDNIVFVPYSCAAQSRSGPIGAAAVTTIAGVINRQPGGNMIFKVSRDAAS